MNQGSAAGGGLALGAFAAYLQNNRSWRNRTRRAEDSAEDAQGAANQALNQIQALVSSGDMERLGSDQVSDLLTGLAFPGQTPEEKPSAFASTPSVLPRPQVTEAMARDVLAWPGRTNEYDASGDLVHPGRALSGQNFLTGVVLNLPEVRAFLAGLGFPGEPTLDQLGQLFRLTRGLITVLTEPAGPAAVPQGGLSLEAVAAAWRRFYAVAAVPGQSGLVYQRIDWFSEPKGIVADTTDETELARLFVPRNTITKVGDRLLAQIAYSVLGQNGTDTHRFRLRLDSLSGTLLFDTEAQDLEPSQHFLDMAAMYRGLVGGVPKLTLGGDMTIPQAAAVASVTFDPTIDHILILTATQSAASAGNQAQAQYGQANLEHAV